MQVSMKLYFLQNHSRLFAREGGSLGSVDPHRRRATSALKDEDLRLHRRRHLPPPRLSHHFLYLPEILQFENEQERAGPLPHRTLHKYNW